MRLIAKAPTLHTLSRALVETYSSPAMLSTWVSRWQEQRLHLKNASGMNMNGDNGNHGSNSSLTDRDLLLDAMLLDLVYEMVSGNMCI